MILQNHILPRIDPMKQILTSLCLTVALLLGSVGVSWSDAELKITEITDKDELRKIDEELD